MNKQIGFIGCGKMAQAMIAGILKGEIAKPNQIIGSAVTQDTRELVKEKYGIRMTDNNVDVAKDSDILFLAVRPDLHTLVINEIKNVTTEHTVVITVAAGIDIDYLSQSFGKNVKIVRSMPNTPSLVGEGMSAICYNSHVNNEDLDNVISIFNSFGKTEVIEEGLMDAIPAISGSSPAYVYMFIEALADGGVMQGIPRQKAYKLAAQAVLGAAKMVLETGEHPGKLKDNVCSPSGATIQAVSTLEKESFRGSILSAMESCTQRIHEISNEKE